jgi:hypothetical protein
MSVSNMVRVTAEMVLNEYYARMAAQTAEDIRKDCYIRLLEDELRRTWARVVELENQVNGGENLQTEAFHVGSSPGV